MTCSADDVLNLLPGYDSMRQQLGISLQAAIDNASAEVSAQLAALLPTSADGPLLRAIVSYRAVANLLASMMSSNDEMGETRLSAYYNEKADKLISGLLNGSLTAFDDNGEVIETEDAPAGLTGAGISLLVFADE